MCKKFRKKLFSNNLGLNTLMIQINLLHFIQNLFIMTFKDTLIFNFTSINNRGAVILAILINDVD